MPRMVGLPGVSVTRLLLGRPQQNAVAVQANMQARRKVVNVKLLDGTYFNWILS